MANDTRTLAQVAGGQQSNSGNPNADDAPMPKQVADEAAKWAHARPIHKHSRPKTDAYTAEVLKWITKDHDPEPFTPNEWSSIIDQLYKAGCYEPIVSHAESVPQFKGCRPEFACMATFPNGTIPPRSRPKIKTQGLALWLLRMGFIKIGKNDADRRTLTLIQQLTLPGVGPTHVSTLAEIYAYRDRRDPDPVAAEVLEILSNEKARGPGADQPSENFNQPQRRRDDSEDHIAKIGEISGQTYAALDDLDEMSDPSLAVGEVDKIIANAVRDLTQLYAAGHCRDETLDGEIAAMRKYAAKITKKLEMQAEALPNQT